MKSKAWLARQARDKYTQQARQHGLRSRAAFKLAQIDQKYRLIKPNSVIVDLGAAPGGWSQYAAKRVSTAEQIIAVDLLAMPALDKVRFIRGDFTQAEIIAQIATALAGKRADVVLSDMAPNISGVRAADQARALALQQAVGKFCAQHLKRDGQLLSKFFSGEASDTVRAQFTAQFACVRIVKPDASRVQSKEIYLLASGYHGNADDTADAVHAI